jgi:hypothetical protein
VSGRPPRPAVLAAVAAITLLTAIAGCTAGPAARPGSTAKAGTSPDSSARAGSPGASGEAGHTPAGNTPAAKPSVAPAPVKPSALPVASLSAASLPQTTTRPRTDDTAFGNAVHDIWLAVTTGNPDYALPAFFPEKAYQQVKAIADPAADWQGRLWSEFILDLAAVHRTLKPGATLTRVTVPAQYAQWIPPGACYNSIGYWHVPGSRVVYREDGVTRSFGIASFISWRGNWYLVHFGAVTRDGAYGIIDDPEPGPGVPGPPGGC